MPQDWPVLPIGQHRSLAKACVDPRALEVGACAVWGTGEAPTQVGRLHLDTVVASLL
jgi:hypothetical protein